MDQSKLIKGVIEQFAAKYECTVIELNEMSDYQTLKIGLDRCRYDVVARMDSDDFSVKERLKFKLNI